MLCFKKRTYILRYLIFISLWLINNFLFMIKIYILFLLGDWIIDSSSSVFSLFYFFLSFLKVIIEIIHMIEDDAILFVSFRADEASYRNSNHDDDKGNYKQYSPISFLWLKWIFWFPMERSWSRSFIDSYQ